MKIVEPEYDDDLDKASVDLNESREGLEEWWAPIPYDVLEERIQELEEDLTACRAAAVALAEEKAFLKAELDVLRAGSRAEGGVLGPFALAAKEAAMGVVMAPGRTLKAAGRGAMRTLKMFPKTNPIESAEVKLGGRATKKITRQRDKRSRRKTQRKRRKRQRKRK